MPWAGALVLHAAAGVVSAAAAPSDSLSFPGEHWAVGRPAEGSGWEWHVLEESQPSTATQVWVPICSYPWSPCLPPALWQQKAWSSPGHTFLSVKMDPKS